jgi:hypothetical protein
VSRFLALLLLLLPVTRPLDSRDYDIDLTFGAARGSPRIVSMGGTTTALAEGAGGLTANPGAVAVRPLSSPGRWDWDAQVSGFSPSIGSDFDNNGVRSDERGNATTEEVALLLFMGPWALGLGAESVNYALAPPAGATTSPAPATNPGTSSANVVHLVLGRTFLDGSFGLGLGARVGEFALDERVAGGDDQDIFSVSGASLEMGWLVAPRSRSWRAGLRFLMPLQARGIDARCDPQDCRGYLLPTGAVAPWQVALGGALRLSSIAWNVDAPGRYRDEPALILSAELLVTGPLERASGLEAFLAHQLQAAGRSTTVGARAGLEKEWLPGRLRLRAGGYWEPSHFQGVGGRAHLTAGGELRLFAFHLWQTERRLALAVAADLAPRYGNVGLSVGFWH